MPDKPSVPKPPASAIPADNLQRNLAVAQPDTDQKLLHIGVVGDTYTILLNGKDTAGGFCLIDMHVPPGGGPPPHRHDFEETFSVLEGEPEATFRGTKRVVRAGETIISQPTRRISFTTHPLSEPVRMLCICSPAGQEEFFLELGVPVATRTTPPPQLDEAA
jgi:quercetin dioxygenase-like cupin family protein